ncbi:hypothetical protein BGS_1084 [Beggiatoa sp. SS]|nr:hypothetical protein BGS_1084 [Beggiatoa sp. SS]
MGNLGNFNCPLYSQDFQRPPSDNFFKKLSEHLYQFIKNAIFTFSQKQTFQSDMAFSLNVLDTFAKQFKALFTFRCSSFCVQKLEH